MYIYVGPSPFLLSHNSAASYILYLVLLYRGILFVTHGADLHAFISLSVSLREKLHHDAVCPLSVQFKRLGGVAEVRTVDHVLKDLR